jgi:predicted transcriptional regulator of viral defense system
MSEQRMHADERIAQLAGRQHGLVTHRQLRQLGVGAGAIRERRNSGHLRRIHIGVYAVGHDCLSDPARMLGAVMACGSEALLSHTHAAAVWGLSAPWEQHAIHPFT